MLPARVESTAARELQRQPDVFVRHQVRQVGHLRREVQAIQGRQVCDQSGQVTDQNLSPQNVQIARASIKSTKKSRVVQTASRFV